MINISLTNQREFVNMLDKIPQAYQPTAVRKILRHAIRPLIADARARAPKSTKPHDFYSGNVKYTIHPGTLSAGMKAWNLKKSRYAGLIFGPKVRGVPTNVAPFYANFVEYGGGTVKQHRGGKFKREKGSWTGPRTKQPFIRPAWDAQKKNVEDRFMKDAIRKFELEIRRLTKKGLV